MHVLSAHAHDWPRMYVLHDIHRNDTGLCMDGMKKLDPINFFIVFQHFIIITVKN